MSQLTSLPQSARRVDGQAIPLPGTYRIDRSHSMVEFVGRYLMVTKVRGRFVDFAGDIHIAENPSDSWVQVTVNAASVDTGDDTRDGHLRSPDFLDVENHPTIEFRSTGVQQSGNSWNLVGDLTILGVTREVAFDLTFDGFAPDPWGNTRLAFTASAEIDREDWGLTWNKVLETGSVLVGRKIGIDLTIQALPTATEG